MKKYKNILLGILLILMFVFVTAVTWIYSQIDSALPQLDGKTTLYGLTKKVTVERDIQGIPTVKASSRIDLAVATGFIHAQERFFQMDLLRRNSAGELASLFGDIALDYDKNIRKHRFRARARDIVNQLPEDQLALIKAYTQGVNQGLGLNYVAPFEYLLLQQDPVEWQEEDTILSVFSMYIDLQYHDGKRERSLGLMKEVLGADVYAFLNPKGSQWDAPIDGSTFTPSAMPQRPWPSASSAAPVDLVKTAIDYQSEQFPGSNNWVVSGEVSTTKSAIIANDMHLGIRVPNTWFRASFEYKDDNEKIKVTGVTLPGAPLIIAGSNGNIAWGFTNSYGDWSDVVILETNEDNSQYLTPDGFESFENVKQIIAVKDQNPVEMNIKETRWGPVIGENHLGQLLAYRWVAHDKEAVNLTLAELEKTKSVDDAFEVASRTGIPGQNMVVGDNQGNIGWTIMGPIPKKNGNIGDTPQSWANGENNWSGYLSFEQYPRVKNPTFNRLWTANSRVVGGEMFEKLGNGGYALGARSSQIKAKLMAKDVFSEQDLLDIALDDSAYFLKTWQQFLLDKVVTEKALAEQPHWHEVHQLLQEKELTASTDSVTYRLVRNFRLAVRSNVFNQLNETLSALDPSFSFQTIRHQIETPLWQMVNDQPANFLWLSELDWPTLLSTSLNQTITDMTIDQPLAKATWGQQNTSNIQHPLSKAVPFIGRWLDMPKTQLPGDSYITRVQGKSFGASERMIVSPGHEDSGILHMPTSQSGHPWSPYYGVGHSDWEQGKASPFLPGKTEYTLTLLSY